MLLRHRPAPPGKRQQQQQQHHTAGSATASAMLNVNKKKKCPFCLDETHQAEDCMKIQGYKERKEIAKSFSKCLICLNSGHKATNCRSKVNCRICGGRRHVSIYNSSNRSEKLNAMPAEQEQAGILGKVADLESETLGKIHYLAHRIAIWENAETTKVRIVFDASCKEAKNGVSINDCLHVGPSLTPLLFDILLRFRQFKICLIGDTEKAFLNIGITEDDRNCLCFLWISDIKADKPQVQVYHYNTVVFGVNLSPFLLNAVLRHHVELFKAIDQEFVSKLIESFYVDDLVTGCDTTKEAFCLYEKARDRLKEASFSLKKWKSNDATLMEKINKEEKTSQAKGRDKKEPSEEELVSVLHKSSG